MAVLSSRAQERRSREIRARSREKNKKLLPPQSPRGFSALARLYYLTRPTKTAMLRRLLCRRLVITDSFQKSPYIFSKFNPLNTDTPLIRTIPTVYSPFCVCLTVVPFCLVVLRNKIWAFFHWQFRSLYDNQHSCVLFPVSKQLCIHQGCH